MISYTSSFRRTTKSCLLSATLLSAAFGAGGAAYAQDADEGAGNDVVVVTGSRIARDPNLTSPVPVQSVDAETLINTGDFNIAETINDLPALLTSTTSEQTVQTTAVDGTNVLNLRGMGTDRTLVLVNGRRHVSGVEGEQSVDIGSIPTGLIERVEVLTGGASAIYGADAVTGVVNFVLKDDFEGLEVDLSGGISDEGDAGQYRGYVLAGKNFDGGKGNFALNVEYGHDDGLRVGDRDFTAGYFTAADWSNPELRFQLGDITSATPNFAAYYNFDNTTLFSRGLSIPTADSFIANYEAEFGMTPTLTSEEMALIQRAADAYPRAIMPYPTFSITSAGGVISPGDFSLARGFDLDGNGTDDCLDSFVGYNNSFDGAASFGLAGGCWDMPAPGQVVPVTDGLIAGNFNHFGGSGILPTDRGHIIGMEDKLAVNFNGRYEISPLFELFGEAKLVGQEIDSESPYNTYWDLIYVAPDNPFIPSSLQPVADATGGLYITRDHNDFGLNKDTVRRFTQRYVAGVRGTFFDDWEYEVAGTYGRFHLTSIDRNLPVIDRLLAATDVTTDEGGNPVCRSDVGGLDYPTAPFDIPPWDGGFYTFTPGAGECVPLDVFGYGAPSAEAVDWITTTTEDSQTITQTVFSANVVGDSSDWFEFQGGPLAFAFGIEYREETSSATYDPLSLGIIPQDGIDAEGNPVPAGTMLNEVSGQNGLVWDPAAELANSYGEFDALDYYAEIQAPLLAGLTGVEELSFGAAIRVADYSTIGQATTYKFDWTYAPIADISFRAGYSQAIRAPNIFELFSPAQGATFRPIDPCDFNEIPTAPNPELRAANCAALGLPADYEDPLSARFFGVVQGNPELTEETAETTTVGLVFQPSFLEGFSFTIDYWDISIDDAIAAVSAQDIVDLCVDSTTIENQYCPLIERNSDTTSPQFGGFTFLRQSQVNFGRLEARGIDMTANYSFEIRDFLIGLSVNATKQDKLDRFFDPADPTAVDPELGELFRPEWSGLGSVSVSKGPVTARWSTSYQGEQLLRGAEIEDYMTIFGPSVLMDETFVHNFSATYEFDNGLLLRGGVNNIFEEEPFITEYSWPAGARGRYFFIGANYTY